MAIFNFLRSFFSAKKDFQLDDLVGWNLDRVQAAIWAEQYGSGPFRVLDVIPQDGCDCGAGPGQCHLGVHCGTQYGVHYWLSDDEGKILKGRHRQPQEFPGECLKRL